MNEFPIGFTSVRAGAVSPAARTVHRAILRAFASTGRAPDPATLTAPDGKELPALLGELHDRDVIRLDEHGRIRAAYPFSGRPTAYRVEIAGGPTVYAMCAIDALGIAAMLGADVTVTSAEPGSGEPIRVVIRDGQATWQPVSAVAVDGTDTSAGGRYASDRDSDGSPVPTVDRCCTVMNFFATASSAHRWLAEHPQVSGTVLTKDQAVRLGTDIFGQLLDD
ncbi:MAG TPA: alkylmercury lyase family protein [Actinomycetes bacterium]|nr:alkylmercury lyase family protein [Actinomycetes bacterium]